MQSIMVHSEICKRAPSSISHPSQQGGEGGGEKAPPGKMKWRYFHRQRLPEEFLLLLPLQLGLPQRLSLGKLRKFSFSGWERIFKTAK